MKAERPTIPVRADVGPREDNFADKQLIDINIKQDVSKCGCPIYPQTSINVMTKKTGRNMTESTGTNKS